jgi:SecD/SecF fusion protein
MQKNVWPIILGVLTVVLVLFSLAITIPPSEKVPLGLDLRGGMSFTVEVDQDAVREKLLARAQEEGTVLTDQELDRILPVEMQDALKRSIEVLRNRVDGLGIAEPIIYPERGNRIVIQLPDIDSSREIEGGDERRAERARLAREKRERAIRTIRDVSFLEFRLVHPDNDELIAKMMEAGKAPEGYKVVNVTYKGRPQYFWERDYDVLPEGRMDAAQQAKVASFNAPPTYEVLLERVEVGNRKLFRPYLVQKKAELDGTRLRKAGVGYSGGLGSPVVKLEFDREGARIFQRLTTAYAPNGTRNPNPVGRQLAIVLDRVVYSAPVIKEPIAGGQAEISGQFTSEEAYFLANVLKAGALPVPVKIVAMRDVSATLGADAIRSGLRAAVMGLVLVALFMLIYYRLAGIVADLSLLLMMLILPVGMLLVAGFMGVFVEEARAGGRVALPVLTLPGIAGIVLTLGMAVDANVLIFERMREEFRNGKGPLLAVAAGFDRALSAILDSNITTILTALVLFIFGSGPIRGYGVTLSAGLLVSMFCAVLVGRLVLEFLAARFKESRFWTMASWFPETQIDFIRLGRYAIFFSLTVIVVSLAAFGWTARRDQSRVLGIEFTGGSSVVFSFDSTGRVPESEIRKALENAGLAQPFVQYQREVGEGGQEMLLVKGPPGAKDEIVRVLAERFPSAALTVESADDVGPQIGRELKVQAAWAVLLSLLIMIVYISWRYEFGFAMGAVLALFHDALFTLGLVYWMGIPVNLTVVAAILTIVGYSVNDTIVIFDRIREDIRVVRGKSFVELCNLSINQTLSRTILTSLTTLLTVLCLAIFGGGEIRSFALTMLVGVIVGTYSTITIATPIVLAWYRYRTPDFSRKTG